MVLLDSGKNGTFSCGFIRTLSSFPLSNVGGFGLVMSMHGSLGGNSDDDRLNDLGGVQLHDGRS